MCVYVYVCVCVRERETHEYLCAFEQLGQEGLESGRIGQATMSD